ncbi:MAG: Uma2 family endonuclease [Dehalococcoidia bacterium]|nr:Uma2 family endonuclease [Dehalococcoidia bacterium]
MSAIATTTPLLDALAGGRPLTVDAYYRLPETPERYELYEGMLIMVPPPDGGHQDIVAELHTDLGLAARRTGGKSFVAPTGVDLGLSTAFEPDAGFLLREHLGRYRKRGIEGPPDIVVEVLSPSTRNYDLRVKLPAYLAAGVAETWIVDPEARTVSIYRPDAPDAPETVAFGERIPSRIADVGDGGLSRLLRLPGGDTGQAEPGQGA